MLKLVIKVLCNQSLHLKTLPIVTFTNNGQKKKRRTDNIMAKRKREGQTTQWPKEKEKDRQHNGQIFSFYILLNLFSS
jgi:hypothetical protein